MDKKNTPVEHLAIVCILHDHEDVLIGEMDFKMPAGILVEHATPEKLNKLVKENIMPEVISQTVKAHLNNLPVAARDKAAADIGKCTVRLTIGDAPLEYHWSPEPGAIKVDTSNKES